MFQRRGTSPSRRAATPTNNSKTGSLHGGGGGTSYPPRTNSRETTTFKTGEIDGVQVCGTIEKSVNNYRQYCIFKLFSFQNDPSSSSVSSQDSVLSKMFGSLVVVNEPVIGRWNVDKSASEEIGGEPFLLHSPEEKIIWAADSFELVEE